VTGVATRRVYLDASALVKLVLPEAETPALTTYLAGDPMILSSRVGHIEVRRAVARISEPGDEEHVDRMFEGVQIIELDTTVAQLAGSVTPAVLRSLDAIHLASALSIRDELEAVVTYDLRLADAAREAGLTVVAPSLSARVT
jgi:predicted nucleic acid-binding protein